MKRKFNLKLAGQYSNNLSNLLNELAITEWGSDSLFTVTENHLKSKIKVGTDINFDDEEITMEKDGKFKDLSIEKRLKLLCDLAEEKSKIDSIIAEKVKENKITSVFTGKEIDIDMAKQENVLYKTKVLSSYKVVSELKDTKSQRQSTQEVAFGDGINPVKYTVEVEKKLDVNRNTVENERLELMSKLDEQSMSIDKVKTNSEFEFDAKYDIRVTLLKLINA